MDLYASLHFFKVSLPIYDQSKRTVQACHYIRSAFDWIEYSIARLSQILMKMQKNKGGLKIMMNWIIRVKWIPGIHRCNYSNDSFNIWENILYLVYIYYLSFIIFIKGAHSDILQDIYFVSIKNIKYESTLIDWRQLCLFNLLCFDHEWWLMTQFSSS